MFDGVVLCGGASRRMGTDKAVLEIDGRLMAARVADALASAGASTVVALGGDRHRLGEAGLDHVEDLHPGEGPLGALVHALGVVGGEDVVAVLACDLLQPDPALISRLVTARATADADVCVPLAAGRPQWALAVWHRRVGRLLGDVFASGERSLVGAASGLRVEFVEGVDPLVCADADTPTDLPDEAV